MSKKKSRMYRIERKTKKEDRVINMNEINVKKAYYPVNFRVGAYMSQKDRPRKRKWDSEIEW